MRYSRTNTTLKRILFSCTLCISILFFNSQRVHADATIPVATTDPSVSQFNIERGDNDPNYTGDLSYSVPLLKVPGINDLDYSIRLDYVTGNGVPASESASWVGLGWNLNLYQITCSPISRIAVLYDTTYTDTYLKGANDLYYLSFPEGSTPIYKFANSWLPLKWSALKIDTLGYGTQTWSTEDTTFQFTDYEGFVVTTVDGKRYVFSECLRQTARDSLITRDFSVGGQDHYNEIYGAYYYTYKLAAILGADYVDGNDNLVPEDGGSKDTGSWIKLEYSTPEEYIFTGEPSLSDNQIIEVNYLETITTPTHRADFSLTQNANNPFIHKGQVTQTYNYKDLHSLLKIKLYTNGGGAPLKTVKLFQNDSAGATYYPDYGSIEGEFQYYYNDSSKPNRQQLDSLQVWDSDSTSILTYKFDYTGEPADVSNEDVVYLDNWGYFKKNMSVDTTDTSWLLEKVTLPTGGTVEFTVESDRYQTYFHSTRGSYGNTVYKKGGVRLVKKVLTDPITAISQKYIYEYGRENKLRPGYGFLSSEPPERYPTYPRSAGLAFGHSLKTDVHYSDVTVIKPDSSKIQKFYSSACTGVKLQTRTGASRDYIWLDQLTQTDTTDFSTWPDDTTKYDYGSGISLWPFWYSCGSTPDTTSQADYLTYSDVIPFRKKYTMMDTTFSVFHPYTYADEAYGGELCDFEDCNYGTSITLTVLDNSWKRGYVLRECFKDKDDTLLQEIRRFYTFKPIAEDAYDAYSDEDDGVNLTSRLRRGFCISGWARIDTLTKVIYDQNGLNSVTHLTHYIYNDTTGLVEQIRQVGDSIKVTCYDYAYSHYDTEDDSLDMLDKHILSAKSRETIYEYPMLYSVPVNNDNMHASRAQQSTVTTWKADWNGYDGQWAPERTFQWKCDSSWSFDYSLPSFDAWQTTQTPTSDEWILTSKILSRDTFSRAKQVLDANSDTSIFYYGTQSDPFAVSDSGHYMTGLQSVIGSMDSVPSSGARPGDDLFVEYEYNDMGQLTKKIDENAKATYFEYDSFWRFNQEKDHNTKVLRKIYYHYKDNGANSIFDDNDPNAILTELYFNHSDSGRHVTYYDGFGRSIQKQIDEGNSLVIQQSIYDSLGRMAVETLPARDSTLTSCDYKTCFVDTNWVLGDSMTTSSYVSDYYDSSPVESYAADAEGYPYTYKKYHAEPLERPMELGQPGYSFRIGSNKEIEYSYLTNTSYISVGDRTYSQNTLLKEKTIEENDSESVNYLDRHGNLVQTVMDSGDSTHLNLTTGFQYDVLGNKTLVIPPNANSSDTSRYCTQMHYNTLGNLIKITTPDAGTVKYKYDAAGNVRFEQDSVHSENGKDLIFHIYDELDRLLITGEACADSCIPEWFTLDGNTDYRDDGTCDFEDFSTDSTQYYVVNTYDTEPSYGSTVWSDAQDPGDLNNLKGRLSATAYYNNDDDCWGYTFYSYNDRGDIDKIIQHLPADEIGVKTIEYEYDRQQNIIQTSYQDGQSDAFYIWYDYDLAGRLSKIYTDTVDTKPGYSLADYSYWPTDRIKRKQLNDPATGNKVQGLDYLYHIRGWLSQINHQNIGSSDPGGDTNDRFGEVIGYESQGHIGSAFGSTNQYNGNISWLIQSTYGYDTTLTGSIYSYDGGNRLLKADYGYYDSSWQQLTSNGNDTRGIGYDDNGNFLELYRVDQAGDSTIYDYTYYNGSNQLKNLNDSSDQDYRYDGNGNLVMDNNRNISNILYDYRNLPYRFDIGTSKLKCGYDSQGNRVYKRVVF